MPAAYASCSSPARGLGGLDGPHQRLGVHVHRRGGRALRLENLAQRPELGVHVPVQEPRGDAHLAAAAVPGLTLVRPARAEELAPAHRADGDARQRVGHGRARAGAGRGVRVPGPQESGLVLREDRWPGARRAVHVATGVERGGQQGPKAARLPPGTAAGLDAPTVQLGGQRPQPIRPAGEARPTQRSLDLMLEARASLQLEPPLKTRQLRLVPLTQQVSAVRTPFQHRNDGWRLRFAGSSV